MFTCQAFRAAICAGEEQAEGFFRAQLGNAGEVLHPETIQNLGSFQLAPKHSGHSMASVGIADRGVR
jgi:hypothetical protein